MLTVSQIILLDKKKLDVRAKYEIMTLCRCQVSNFVMT